MGSSPSQPLIRAVRKALRERANPVKAAGMRAYMKSAMPYRGVQTPEFRRAVKAVFALHPLSRFDEWRDTVLVLWRTAKYREERYAAIEFAGYPRYRGFRTMDALPIYEELIVSGAWWDYVDAIATRHVGALLREYPDAMAPQLRQWARSESIWKRRAAILAQLGFKRDTDRKLLYDCMRPSLDSTEFFLRKGMGWALREYAKTDAREVIRYVRQHEARLSALTKREALRRVAPYSSRER